MVVVAVDADIFRSVWGLAVGNCDCVAIRFSRAHRAAIQILPLALPLRLR